MPGGRGRDKGIEQTTCLGRRLTRRTAGALEEHHQHDDGGRDDRPTREGGAFPRPPPTGSAAAAGERVGCWLGEDARVAWLPGARDDEQWLRGQPRKARLLRQPRGGAG